MNASFHITYEVCLNLSIQHHYYANGFCPYLELVPSPAGKKALRDLNLEFYQVPNGGKILARKPETPSTAFASQLAAIEFYLLVTHTEVYAVTELEKPTSPTIGIPSHLFRWESGSWVANSGAITALQVPAGVFGIVQIETALDAENPLEIKLEFNTPTVQYQYFIVSGPDFSTEIQIEENGTIISTTGAQNSEDLALVSQKYIGKKIWPLQIDRELKRKFPSWYLVSMDGFGGSQIVQDLPNLPKPNVNSAPQMILDYSALLK